MVAATVLEVFNQTPGACGEPKQVGGKHVNVIAAALHHQRLFFSSQHIAAAKFCFFFNLEKD